MPPPPQSFGACQERAGFLFAHDCPRSATLSCTRCAKPICSEHSRFVEEEELCVECARAAQADPDDDDPLLYSSHYYDDYGHYGPGSWGHDALHDPNDFTEADGEALRGEQRPGDFEEDMQGS
jgi:hypothetical protein